MAVEAVLAEAPYPASSRALFLLASLKDQLTGNSRARWMKVLIAVVSFAGWIIRGSSAVERRRW